jgi:hypothetical protein
MTESEVQVSLSSLRQQSRVSLVLMLLGAAFLLFSILYSRAQVRPLEMEIEKKKMMIATLEKKIEAKKAEEAALNARIQERQAQYEKLKANTEELYAVRVTPSQQVYQVKATAIATGRTLANGLPEYRFSLLINTPPATLNEIAKVTYRMNHPSFKRPINEVTDAASRFAYTYTGWGCLNSVKVTVQLKSGVTHDFDFDMCRSLGQEWGKLEQ